MSEKCPKCAIFMEYNKLKYNIRFMCVAFKLNIEVNILNRIYVYV